MEYQKFQPKQGYCEGGNTWIVLHDGFGDNWPIRYSDLAPYYDRVEPMFKVSGQFYVKSGVLAVVPEAREGKGGRGLMGGGGFIPAAKHFPAYGEELQKQLDGHAGTGFSITAMGEALPRRENFVRINSDVKDEWGIPAAHITQKYSDNEHAVAKDAMETGIGLCGDSGFEAIASHAQMAPPGESIHELGTCRMGNNPKTSVLNAHNPSHDLKNLFVVDGGSFVSRGVRSPTLALLALSMRAGEYILEMKKKGSL